jgi:hypothetical protein
VKRLLTEMVEQQEGRSGLAVPKPPDERAERSEQM